MKNMKLLSLLLLLFICGCSEKNEYNNAKAEIDYTTFVDPFIGTGEHGHTYPGAATPFGMVQLSPDTRMENWDGSSGYHYSDKTILGFSHTHLSGTGQSELCDVLLMPTIGDIKLVSGDEDNSKTGYRSTFSHDNEEASPGYYKVLLDDYNITAELTATKRSGFHRYTFPESEQSNIIIDLKHRGNVINSNIQIVSDSVITGLTKSTGWAVDQYIYFYAEFSKQFNDFKIAKDDKLVDNITEAEGSNIKAYVSFNTKKNEQILVKVGISAVSATGAKNNLEAENSGWNFAEIRSKSKNNWNDYLSKIEIEGGSEREQRIFYTSLYHTALAPNLFMDVDGNYRGVDHKVHKAEGFTNYTIFSLWDVFRTEMPLLTIIEPTRMNDFIKTALSMYKIAGRLPRWEIHGTLSANMIGYHSLPLILDAYNKGIQDYNVELAFEGMKNSMENINYYNNYGFIPADIEGTGGSVSIVMENAYNDWCVAEMAKILNENNDYLLYQQRAQFYINLFDSTSGFMRPKNRDYNWVEPFDPAEPSGHYVEGNAFQYSAFVPHDVSGLIRLIGGDEKFVEWLDTLFTHKSKFDKNVVDASGLIGQYAHGNEPSHHIPYLYNFAGAAPKTQKYVAEILNSLYNDTPDGLSGNEDCGQISAWYVMSSMGFYSLLAGEPVYIIGSPLFEKATINLESGKEFVIRANNVSEKNIFIQSAKLNGKPYTKSWFAHQEILDGGEFIFEMGEKPNYNWGTSKEDRPTTRELIPAVSMPYYKVKENYFFNKATISLGCATEGAKIYFTINGSTATDEFEIYTEPFELNETTEIEFFAEKEGLLTTTNVKVKIEKIEKIDFTQFTNYEGGNFKPGLKYKYYEEDVLSVEEFSKYMPKKTGITPNFSIENRDNDTLFGFIYTGFIKIPADGVYTFFLSTNDGGVLYLDGKIFIDNHGPGTATTASRIVALRAGIYEIGEKYFQMGGGYSNNINWKGPDIRKEIIPASVLFHK